MENSYSGGGSWSMIPNIMSQHSNPATPPSSNQENNLYYQQPQQQSQSQQHFPNQFQQHSPMLPPQQRYQSPPQYQIPQQYQSQQQQQQQFQQQQQNQHQSLASHFHLLHLVENLGHTVGNGTRDQHSDDLVNQLNNHFEKCQQLLNSISGSINSKAMTVDGQKCKLEESEHLLNKRRDLLAKYRNIMDDLIETDL